METSCKRMRKAAEESNGEGGGGGELAAAAVGGGGGGVEEEEAVEETNEGAVVSEEMEAKIQAIFERIESFTQQVSDMLETGKAMLSNLSQQFEERLIASNGNELNTFYPYLRSYCRIHKEQVGKWQEEIKELRSLDASNAATHSLLQSAQFHLFQSVTEEHS